MKTKLLVLMGPAGCGKTSIQFMLTQMYPSVFTTVTGWTTRTPRDGEIAGSDYNFTNQYEFLQLVSKGYFYEWVYQYGAYYGISKGAFQEALNTDKIVVLVLTPDGLTEYIREHSHEMFTITLLPPLNIADEVAHNPVRASRIAMWESDKHEYMEFSDLVFRPTSITEACKRIFNEVLGK